VVQDVDISVFT